MFASAHRLFVVFVLHTSTSVIDLMFTFYARHVDAVDAAENYSQLIKPDEYCALDAYLSLPVIVARRLNTFYIPQV